MEAALD
ncbi:Hypothetical protein EIN_026650, partial [Entamoeba invadens IP1]